LKPAHAQVPGFPDQIKTQSSRDRVASHWDQADDRV
jgi:hypothetical protein